MPPFFISCSPSFVRTRVTTIIGRQVYSDAQTRRVNCVNIRWYRQTVAKVRGTWCAKNDARILSSVGEFLSDAPFFGLSLCAEFQLANCACASGWSSTLEPRSNMALFGYPSSNSCFWSCQAHTRESRGLCKVSAVTICIASFPWG